MRPAKNALYNVEQCFNSRHIDTKYYALPNGLLFAAIRMS